MSEKKGFWARAKEDFMRGVGPSVKLDYLGGHPKIKKGTLTIVKGKEQDVLYIGKHDIHVKRIEWDEKGKRSAGKAVAGTVVGGVLTGGIGALAGAAIGGRKKDDSLAVITFTNGESDVEHTMYFRCDQKEYQKLSALL